MEEVPTLLRAELAHAGRKFVGHTTVLTPNTSFVRIDEEIELGTPVELELSFRNYEFSPVWGFIADLASVHSHHPKSLSVERSMGDASLQTSRLMSTGSGARTISQ